MTHQTLNAARQALLVESKPDEALQILQPLVDERQRMSALDQRPVIELAGYAYEQKHQFDMASEYFLSIGDWYHAGYSQMLKGTLDKAFDYWRNLLPMRPNHWCLTLSGLITGRLNSMPTFLQIRNHMEADIVHLIQAGQYHMAMSIVRYAEVLAEINFESFKFAGRALYNAGRLEEAGPYLLRGQKSLPNDPEIYYHLGQYYHATGKHEDAILMLQQCVLISPSYTPAHWLLDDLRKGKGQENN